MDTDNKMNDCLEQKAVKSTCLDQRNFKKQEQNYTIQYHMLALLALLCASENWTIEARDPGRITAAQTKYIWEKQQDTLGQIIKQTQRLQKN